LFDPNPIGIGSSGLSSGLLHAFAGKHAHKSWEADKSIEETHRLFTVASSAINKPLILAKGIMRPALSKEQIESFQICAKTHQETQWWDKEACESKIKGLNLPDQGGGLFIPNGLTIDSNTYLQGLWQACALLGTQFHRLAMIRKSDLSSYDRILIAMGPYSKNFPPLKDLPIEAVKGQMLEIKWPTHVPPPPYSLVSKKYLVMNADHTSCLVGSTYEHAFDSPQADLEKAKQDILPAIFSFFPALQEAPILGCRAAFRASTRSHLPLMGRLSDNTYFFTGLGSKGLLYHAWLGKQMARTMLTSHEKHLPFEVFYQPPTI
jgi:glycine/D-amino acid oxidase-like deaminating enzyme